VEAGYAIFDHSGDPSHRPPATGPLALTDTGVRPLDYFGSVKLSGIVPMGSVVAPSPFVFGEL
jgi:hypothetical protein